MIGQQMTPSIDLDRVRRSLRIRPASKVSERFDSVVEEVLAEFHSLAEMRACWSLQANNFSEFPPGLARFSQMVLVAITGGESISERLSELMRDRKLFHANILDTMTNQAIDTITGETDDQFRAELRDQGLFLSRRFSPGCPHMEMDQLPTIIDALDASSRIGVSCTPAHMLLPVKSIAYVHGADASLLADQPIDFCDTCRKTSCIRSRRNRDDP